MFFVERAGSLVEDRPHCKWFGDLRQDSGLSVAVVAQGPASRKGIVVNDAAAQPVQDDCNGVQKGSSKVCVPILNHKSCIIRSLSTCLRTDNHNQWKGL